MGEGEMSHAEWRKMFYTFLDSRDMLERYQKERADFEQKNAGDRMMMMAYHSEDPLKFMSHSFSWTQEEAKHSHVPIWNLINREWRTAVLYIIDNNCIKRENSAETCGYY